MNTELNLYNSDGTGAFVTVIGYVIGFVVIYAITGWLLERYFKGKSSQPQPPPSPFAHQ